MLCTVYIYIYIYIHCPPKVWKRPRKWGFGQYWHASFLICDNFALIRGNTNYKNIFYYMNSLYIENTYLFDSSKYPPLAAITALHNLGIRAVSLFKHWYITPSLLKDCPKMIHTGWTLLTDITVQFSSSIGVEVGWLGRPFHDRHDASWLFPLQIGFAQLGSVLGVKLGSVLGSVISSKTPLF